MADVVPVLKNAHGADDGSVKTITWPSLNTTDSNGVSVPASLFADKTVTFTKDFSTASVVLEGSNDPIDIPDASAEWFPLTDPQGNAISKSAASMEAVTENPLRIRPRLTGGNGSTNVDVIVLARLSNTLRT